MLRIETIVESKKKKKNSRSSNFLRDSECLSLKWNAPAQNLFTVESYYYELRDQYSYVYSVIANMKTKCSGLGGLGGLSVVLPRRGWFYCMAMMVLVGLVVWGWFECCSSASRVVLLHGDGGFGGLGGLRVVWGWFFRITCSFADGDLGGSGGLRMVLPHRG